MQKYNTVIIIGNGFDLNLGYDTSYGDFIKGDLFRTLSGYDNNALCQYLEGRQELESWIDIEKELKEYALNVCEKTSPARKQFKKEYIALCDALCSHLNRIDLEKFKRDSHAVTQLREIMEKGLLNNAIVFDFNYTNSYEFILNKYNDGSFPMPEIINLHGLAAKNTIVFGVEDASNESIDTFLLKSVNENLQIHNVSEKMQNAQVIHMYGYSLGATDHTYFKNFFNKLSYHSVGGELKDIYITYYPDDDARVLLFGELRKLVSGELYNLRRNCNLNLILVED